MKRIVCLLALLASPLCLMAQTPQEIVARMSETMEARESEGVYMIVDVRVPIIGTISSKTWILGEKTRIESKMLGTKMIIWEDETTEWSYNVKKNTVEISSSMLPAADSAAVAGTESNSDGDLSMFSGIDKDYEIVLQKETEDAWYLRCKRRKEVKDDDAPKTINLVVAKGTFLPISFSAKASGATLTMHDIAFGVSAAQVTFNPADYPSATIIDKR
ncbi:MAG: hypothetical protein IJK20_03685 [Bacteroidales bacterium]|nr:hypothetical protein [Bacteroidales bacterium]